MHGGEAFVTAAGGGAVRTTRVSECAQRRAPHRHRTRQRQCTVRAAEAPPSSPLGSSPPPGGGGGSEGAARLHVGKSSNPLPRLTLTRATRRVATAVLFLSWPFAGTTAFTVVLTALCATCQLDYYRIARAQSHLPAVRTGIMTTLLLMATRLRAPMFADAVVPICGAIIVCYLLFRLKPRIATIADASITFTGLFYAGLLPSYYVRLHSLEYLSPPIGGVLRHTSSGALTIFSTIFAEAFADLLRRSAFPLARRCADHRRSRSLSAGIGFVGSVLVGVASAFLLGWPAWVLSGVLYGVILGLCGLIGRVTPPMFIRAGGDEGDYDIVARAAAAKAAAPTAEAAAEAAEGHRRRTELLRYRRFFDLVDSYVFAAPLVYYYVTLALPLLADLAARA